MHRVVARTAVAHADVEIPVGPEHEVAAVVVVEWLGDDTLAVGPAEIETRVARSARSGSPLIA